MARHRRLDYPKLTKRGMLLGFGLFLAGLLGQVALPGVLGAVPAWELSLFLDAEFLGIALVLLSPFVFGIALPLTE